MRRLSLAFSLLVLLFLLTACGSRHGVGLEAPGITSPQGLKGSMGVTGEEWLAYQLLHLTPTQPTHWYIQGELALGESRYRSRVDLFADRDLGLMLSLRPFPIVEAARLYLSPTHVSLYNLMQELYVTCSYRELSDYLGYEVSYRMLWDLLLGEPTALEGKTIQIIGDSTHSLLLQNDGSVIASYHVGSQGALEEIRITEANQTSLIGHYQRYEEVLREVHLSLNLPKQYLSLHLDLQQSKSLTSDALSARLTEPQQGYTYVPLEEVHRLLP